MITTDLFYSEFYKETAKGKEFHDSFRSSVLVLPFTSNPSTSNYDRTCGLRGITGEFFRRSKDKQAKAIENFEKNAIIPVRSYLENVKHMKEKQVDDFIDIMTDIMYEVPSDPDIDKVVITADCVRNGVSPYVHRRSAGSQTA